MKIEITCDKISLYDVECLLKLFLPLKRIRSLDENEYVEIYECDSKINLKCFINNVAFSKEFDQNMIDDECVIFSELYKFLCEQTDIYPPWGILTGIRPVKLLRSFVQKMGRDAARRHFEEKFLVSKKKLDIAFTTMDFEDRILEFSSERSVSLYIAIPFCPTKCLYCSFVSSSVEKSMHLVQKYVDLLCVELEYTANLIKKLNLKLETVYMGGGTPTTLSASQLQQITNTLNDKFNMKNGVEFTVEAGRPDTITIEKLKVLKKSGVTRISINPQTLNDQVLKIIGRKHSAKKTLDSFSLARSVGFSEINMDLIAGLPGDSVESFKKSLEGVLNLAPENITIHTLSIKRASNFNKKSAQTLLSESERVSKMLDFADGVLIKSDFHPYYLYRQANMIGNLENVGWSKEGKECFYNVYIMDEVHTILSCGAGGVTKIKDPNSNRIERVFNFKYPYEYISRFDELLLRKEQVSLFYDKL